jgi:acetoin utilization deacetylase AcuC-like enzyme
MGGMKTSREGFGGLAATLLAAAGTSAQDRIAFFLEGGYDLASLTEASKLEIEPMVRVVRKYWKL